AGTGTDAADLEAAAAETVGTRDLAAVEGDQVVTRAEASRGDLGAFTIAALDRDAGDALQRLGEVGVRELADVLGADRVDHPGGVALDVHRVLETVAQAGDDDGVEVGRIARRRLGLLRGLFRLLRVLREYRIDDQHATDEGEHCL